jgi:hypothetical protein
MAASVLEPHILQDLCLDLDMELGHGLAHAMHLTIAAWTSLLIVGKVIFDTLTRPCERQFLFQLDDLSRERFLLGFKRSDFGSICRQLRHQHCNVRIAGSYHPILESEPPLCVNSSIRHLQPAI